MRRRGVAILGGSLVLWLAVGVSLGDSVDPTAPVAAPTTTSSAPADTSTSATTDTSTTTTTTSAVPVAATTVVAPAPVAPPPVDAPEVAHTTTSPGAVVDAPTGPSRLRSSGRTPPVVGRIVVPRLGLDTTAYDGGDLAQIDFGPSHMPNTAYPGHLGNTVFAGHRVTKTHPFRDLGALQRGDRVYFYVGGQTYEYSFTRFEVVDEDGIQILTQRNAYEATLFACHPPGSDAFRIVAHFTMVNAPTVVPTTATTSPPGSGGSGGSTTPTTKPKPIQLPRR